VGPLEKLPAEVDHLLHSLTTLSLSGESYGTGEFVLTNYVFFMLVSIAILGVVMTLAVRRLALVPEGRLSNAVEALAEFVRNDIAGSIIGKDGRKYFPFIATVFFFILINNFVGLVPGSKPGTGTMGVTVALSTIVFVYFNAVGIKNQGVLGYMKSFSPKGVPFPINLLVWVIEVFSAFLRIVTLAVRLFANMYAGHIILGIFALLTGLFAEQMIEHFSAASVVGALPSIGWLALMTALYLLEVLVAFVQAYVFTLLTAVYIGSAAHEH
jgi:F-type H+-transporting ATPase subunit a